MKTFFDHWDHLDNFKELDEHCIKICNQEVRGAIIDILALGITDNDPMTGKTRKRHVLNAKELLERVNERLENEIKKSNLYFHLQKLEDAGLVEAVDQIPKGKQYITYYGRTAKAFTTGNKKYLDEGVKELLDKGLLTDLVTRIKGANSQEINDKIAKAFGSYDQSIPKTRLAKWLDKYQRDVLELEIDIRRLFDLFTILSRFDDETVEEMREIIQLLDFPIDIEEE